MDCLAKRRNNFRCYFYLNAVGKGFLPPFIKKVYEVPQCSATISFFITPIMTNAFISSFHAFFFYEKDVVKMLWVNLNEKK